MLPTADLIAQTQEILHMTNHEPDYPAGSKQTLQSRARLITVTQSIFTNMASISLSISHNFIIHQAEIKLFLVVYCFLVIVTAHLKCTFWRIDHVRNLFFKSQASSTSIKKTTTLIISIKHHVINYTDFLHSKMVWSESLF